MTATYTFDVFCSLDGYGSYSGGDWGGYWGKQGPEFLDHRLAVYSEEQRMVLGANTFRQFVQLLGPSTGESDVGDPWFNRMRSMPATVVSTTLQDPLDWPNATVLRGDAVDVLQEPGLRANGLHEHPHGVRTQDQALRLAIEGEAAIEELRSLLAPVATPITFGTVGAVAVKGGVDVEGVESGHVISSRLRSDPTDG